SLITTFLCTSRLFTRSLLTWDSAISARSSRFVLDYTYSGLQFLELLLATLHCQLLCLIQAMLQVLHGLLQVLLHPLQVGTGVLLLLKLLSHHGCLVQAALHGLYHSQVIPLQLINFLILLSNSPVNIGLDLVELKLDAQKFAFFVF
uniref:Uncharacterized protein n=1 Tax=Salvator merianae TaxID=96440 RepID=A0A8D0EFS7_SALMN